MTRLHMPDFGAPENVIAAQERWERRHRVRRAVVYGKATTKEVAAALHSSLPRREFLFVSTPGWRAPE